MDRLGPQLSRVTLKQHDTLMGAREKIKNAYFLEDGIVSVVTNLRDGNTVEVVCWAGAVWSDCLP